MSNKRISSKTRTHPPPSHQAPHEKELSRNPLTHPPNGGASRKAQAGRRRRPGLKRTSGSPQSSPGLQTLHQVYYKTKVPWRTWEMPQWRAHSAQTSDNSTLNDQAKLPKCIIRLSAGSKPTSRTSTTHIQVHARTNTSGSFLTIPALPRLPSSHPTCFPASSAQHLQKPASQRSSLALLYCSFLLAMWHHVHQNYTAKPAEKWGAAWPSMITGSLLAANSSKSSGVISSGYFSRRISFKQDNCTRLLSSSATSPVKTDSHPQAAGFDVTFKCNSFPSFWRRASNAYLHEKTSSFTGT